IAVSGLTANSQVVLSPQADTLYVTEPSTGTVAVFSRNTTTGTLTAQPALTITPSQNVVGALVVNAAGTKAYLGGAGGLEVYTRNSNGSLSNPSTLYQPTGLGAVKGLALSQDGKYLHAISQANNALVVLDTTNLSVTPVASFSGSSNGLVGASAIAVS